MFLVWRFFFSNSVSFKRIYDLEASYNFLVLIILLFSCRNLPGLFSLVNFSVVDYGKNTNAYLFSTRALFINHAKIV